MSSTAQNRLEQTLKLAGIERPVRIFGPWPKDERSELLGYLYQTLGIDDEWATIRPDGFDWWAQPLRQRVTVSEITTHDGIDLFRCLVETDVAIMSISKPDLLNLVNRLASFSACAVKLGGVTTLASSFVCHEQFLPQLRSIIALTMGLQQTEATKAAFLIARAGAGEPATSCGPGGEERVQADGMASGAAAIAVQKSDNPLPDSSVWEWMASQFNGRGWYSNPDSDGVAYEVPFGSYTALGRIDSSQEHPTYGAGVLMRLHLPAERPIRLAPKHGGVIVPMAIGLNLSNTTLKTGPSAAHAIGGWCIDDRHNSVTNVVFVPAFVSNQTTIVNLALSMGNRASNLGRDVGSLLTSPGPSQTSFERVAGLQKGQRPMPDSQPEFLDAGLSAEFDA